MWLPPIKSEASYRADQDFPQIHCQGPIHHSTASYGASNLRHNCYNVHTDALDIQAKRKFYVECVTGCLDTKWTIMWSDFNFKSNSFFSLFSKF